MYDIISHGPTGLSFKGVMLPMKLICSIVDNVFLCGVLLFCMAAFRAQANDFPVLIAHHAGGGEYPENTLYAIKKDIHDGFRYINITLMLSKDGVPILFHGFDLAKTTNGKGNPENFSVRQLKRLDAGYVFKKQGTSSHPFRAKGLTIATFNEVLKAIPSTSWLIADIKTHHYTALVDTLRKRLSKALLARIIFYSTDARITAYLKHEIPSARVFQDRDVTRRILLQAYLHVPLSFSGVEAKKSQWMGFENSRTLDLCEHFTLGQACTALRFYPIWNKDNVRQLKRFNPHLKTVMIAVNSVAAYRYARQVGMFAVYTDYPRRLRAMAAHKIKKR